MENFNFNRQIDILQNTAAAAAAEEMIIIQNIK